MVDFLNPEIKSKKILSPKDWTIDYSWIKEGSCRWLDENEVNWYDLEEELYEKVKDYFRFKLGKKI